MDIGSAVYGEFGCGDSEHVRMVAEGICVEEEVRVTSGRCRERSKVVDIDNG